MSQAYWMDGRADGLVEIYFKKKLDVMNLIIQIMVNLEVVVFNEEELSLL